MTKENADALLNGITIQVAAAVRAKLITTSEAERVLEDAIQSLLRGKMLALSERLTGQ